MYKESQLFDKVQFFLNIKVVISKKKQFIFDFYKYKVIYFHNQMAILSEHLQSI